MYKATLAGVMAVTLTSSLAGQTPQSKLKVYCHAAPNPSGFVDQTTQARLDSLKDLKEAIVKKKDWLQLVEAEAQADITVEVMERVTTISTTTPTTTTHLDDKGKLVTTRTSSRPITNYTLKTVMRVGSYENPMLGLSTSEYLGGNWRAAAGQVAGEIEQWAKANLARLRTQPQAAGRASSAAPRAGAAGGRAPAGPRQTIIDWYLAPTVQASEAFLLKSTLSQVQAFRASATPEQAVMVELVDLAIAPGPSFAKMGRPVVTKGQPVSTIVVTGQPGSEFALQTEAVAGDRAFVPASIKYGDSPAVSGTFELAREDGAWRIAALDMGRDPRPPRLDSPKFITDYSALVVRALEQEQARLRQVTVIAKLRTLASAQFTFAAIHGGVYAPLDCLAKPRLCAPADPPNELLIGGMDVPGYTGVFHAGPPATAADLRAAKGARRGLKGFAYVMSETAAGAEARSYCVDSTGLVCRMPDGPALKIVGAVCPKTCVEVK